MNNRLRVNIKIIGSCGNSPHHTTTNTHTNINHNKPNNHKTNNQNTQNIINTNINSNNTIKTHYGKQRQFKN